MSKAWGVTQNKLKGRLCCIAATGLVIWGFVIFSIHELPPGDKHQLSGIHEADAKAQVVSRTESPSAASFSVHQEMNAQELATLIRSHVLNANNSDNFVNEQHRQGCPAYEAVLEDVISPWRINDTIRGSTIPPKTLTSWCDMTVTGGEADDGALIALHSDGEEPLQMFVKVCGKEAVLEREKIKEGIRPPSVRDLQHEYRHLTYTLQQVMKHRLPSQPMVFAMRTGEMPGLAKVYMSPVPVFSPVGSSAYWDIAWPNEKFLEFELRRGPEAAVLPWSARWDRAFWRGSLALRLATVQGTEMLHPRVQIFRIASQNPDLFDVRLSEANDVEDTLSYNMAYGRSGGRAKKAAQKLIADLKQYHIGPIKKDQHMIQHAKKFKYILILSGTVCSWRLAESLSSGAVVVSQYSPTFEFVAQLARPWVHYVPVKEYLSDLVQVLTFLREHDKEAELIAAAGYRLWYSTMQAKDAVCFMRRSLDVMHSLIPSSHAALFGSRATALKHGWFPIPHLSMGDLANDPADVLL